MSPLRNGFRSGNKGRKHQQPSNKFAGWGAIAEKENDENAPVDAYDSSSQTFVNTGNATVEPHSAASPRPNDTDAGAGKWTTATTKRDRRQPQHEVNTGAKPLEPLKQDPRKTCHNDNNWRNHPDKFEETTKKATYQSKASRQQQQQPSLQAKGRPGTQGTRFSKIASGVSRVKTQIIGTKGVSTRFGSPDELAERRTKDHKILYSSIKIGTIHHREDMYPYGSDEIAAEDKKYVHWIEGKPWYKKGRYWIVVSRTRYTVTEVPIYTYNDTALANKHPKTWPEYLVLCPKGVDPKTMKTWGDNSTVLEAKYLTDAEPMSRMTMVVRFTEVKTRNTDVPGVRIIGELVTRSANLVAEAAKNAIGKTPAAEDEC